MKAISGLALALKEARRIKAEEEECKKQEDDRKNRMTLEAIGITEEVIRNT